MIGIPFVIQGDPLIQASTACQRAAVINKIDLFYFDQLEKTSQISVSDKQLLNLRCKYNELLKLTAYLAKLFKKINIPYVVMKTLKPFPYAGSDVDVLIYSPTDFSKALKALEEDGFLILGNDLFSATLSRRDYGLNVDLQLEVSVSGLVYLKKDIILANTVQMVVKDVNINTLAKPSEVVLTACHCFYKEHMYTIADFYTTILSITEENAANLCELAQKTNNVVAVSALLSWTQQVAFEAFRIKLPGIDSALKVIGKPTLANLLLKNGLPLPLKFSKSFVALSLFTKFFTDKYARGTIPRGLFSSLSRKQYLALIDHFKRESY